MPARSVHHFPFRIPCGFLLTATLLSSNFGIVLSQQIQSTRWNIGALNDSCPSVWPLAEGTDWQSQADTNLWYGDSQIGIRAFASGQFSPNVRAFGNGTARTFAESIGWKAGMEMAGHFKRFKWNGMLDHWRLSNVSEADWNQAWQWGIWDGNGWSWNPNQSDIALIRATGHVNYVVSPSIQLEIGQGQHHWGKGWRSLWLDRQAASLPYARLFADAGRVRYTHLIGRSTHRAVGSPSDFIGDQNLSPGNYTIKRPSWFAAHLVDVDFGRGWSGELFGAVSYLANDSGYNHRFEASYALPFIAFRPTEYSLGSADNALLGAALSWEKSTSSGHWRLYGQILLDELVISELRSDEQWWANKWGALGSIHYGSLDKRWKLVLEAAAIRPYTYSHAAQAQSWTHNRQPLAHPAGSNFAELRSHVFWNRGNFLLHVGAVVRRQAIDEMVVLGKEPAVSIGSDPLLTYITRPSNYGVEWFFTGDGQAGDTDIINQLQTWIDLSYSIPKLEGQELFIRSTQNNWRGSAMSTTWLRVEAGIRLRRVLEERNW
jgi:hypothetical protein